MTVPRIYVACLASYNNGILHGAWIDCTISSDHIQDQLNKMLKASTILDAEEWEIHDYEYFYGCDPSGRSFDDLHEIALFVEEHEDLGGELLDIHCDLDKAKEVLEDDYLDCFESIADYAEELTTSCYDIPKYLEYYIDFDAMARDMELNGEFYSIETGYQEHHIFIN